MSKSVSLLVFITLASYAKVFSQPEEMTLKHIPEVTVVKSNRDFFSDDYPSLSVDPASLLTPRQNLGYLLERESPALVKSYGGTGSLVSVSLHGTGSNHTQISWNGFPLNSPASGMADLSLIPSGFMQTVEIINGASGALFGSGTFGGSINMNNEPDWNNRLRLKYSFDAGSFGTFGNSLFFSTGNRRIQYHASVIVNQAENDYPYQDYYRYDAPRVRATHNAFRTWGFIQNLYVNLGRGHYLEGGVWYQHKMKELPPLMGSYHENNAVQRDSLFRSYLSYRKTTEKSALVVRSAYFSDFLHYTDRFSSTDPGYSLDSRIASNRLMNEADYRYYVSDKLIFGGGMAFNLSTGSSENYGGKIHEQDYALFGSMKIRLNDWILNTGIRKEFYEDINPPLQYSLGVRFKATHRLVFRSGISSKFRKPTFNERYWIPGGNPDLNPEKGWGGELSAEWILAEKPENGFQVEALVNAYFQQVDNWIQWVLRDSLTPVEYKKVHAGGIESLVEYSFRLARFHIKGHVGYSYNRSVIADTYDHNPLYIGRQLMYVPKHSGKAGIKAVYRGYMMGANALVTGARETVETGDITLRLEPHGYIDFMVGLNRRIAGIDLGVYGRIDNIFDTQYEVIRSYPMPGRSFLFTLTLGLVKTGTEQ
jgi:outer membrane cobalamin receptor